MFTGKRIGLFFPSMGTDENSEKTYFEKTFPKKILLNAQAKAFLGGLYAPAKVAGFSGFIERFSGERVRYVNSIDMKKLMSLLICLYLIKYINE